jgi:hypothetical protein
MTPAKPPAQTHGAYSEEGLRGRKTALRRRFLKVRGLREADLDPVTVDLLGSYVAVAAVVEAIDDYFAEHGPLEPSGEPRPPAKLYIAALNSMQRAQGRLEERLAKRTSEADPFAQYMDDPQ